MRDEPERMKLDHSSLDRSEIFKATELTGKQRYVHSMLKVEAPPTYFEIHLNNWEQAHNLHKLIPSQCNELIRLVCPYDIELGQK